ncbi:MAG: cysteine desulfurase family protein [Lacisediminihabitans sp.]
MMYLDSAATTAVRREVLEAMWPYLTGEFGNPSSHHPLGETAATALDLARRAVARWLGCRRSEVLFTSGGTEADNLAVKGLALAKPRGHHIVTTAIEHEAVLESCDYLVRQHGFELTIVGVDHDGIVDLVELASAVRPDTALVSVMYANNEVGSIQPIPEIAEIAHANGARMHSDAVQAAGSVALDVAALGVDALSVSGHKLGAPKGIGALYLRGGVAVEPILHGGGQERGRRSGTENVAGAVGLATAIELNERTREADAGRLVGIRDRFIDTVLTTVSGAILTGPRHRRLPGHASFCFPGTSGESILLQLEQHDIVCSSGSACAAGSDEPSHVLVAMGLEPAVAQTAVRFTFGREVTAEHLNEAAERLRDAVSSVRGIAVRPASAASSV